MGDFVLNVNVVWEPHNIELEHTDKKICKVTCVPNQTTAEDVCIEVSKALGIGTLARHLFALQVTGKKYFLPPSNTFNEKLSLNFRIRFKPANIHGLYKHDPRAYEYYFYQVRIDLLESKVSDIVYEKHKDFLFGLGVTDMYRVMIEKDIPRETVEKEYKKYIPKEVIRKHPHFFIKGPIHNTLMALQREQRSPLYIKTEYIKKFEDIAPEYLSETYDARLDENGSVCNITLKISPYHPTEPGIKYSNNSTKDKWTLLCAIEDVGSISITQNNKLMISRNTGHPFYCSFNSSNALHSFISVVDGYYRLSHKWTFNICNKLHTPSLKKLRNLRCHGPVGGEFAYSKLEAKRGYKHGCYIIRESETKYKELYIDVCVKDGHSPKTFKIELIGNEGFVFNDDRTKYKSITDLEKNYSNASEKIYLKECLPPSEYDQPSQLLLCRNEKSVNAKELSSTSTLDDSIKFPRCVNCLDLIVYKGVTLEGARKKTMVHKALWKFGPTQKKKTVAMKILKKNSYDRLEDFLKISGQWAFLQSDKIVRLYGITMINDISFILEYFPYGPLDIYLRNNEKLVTKDNLIQAATDLASALWHLDEKQIVHGKIRCRKLLVANHNDKILTIKLTDPGIHSSYPATDIHWIPVECYGNFELARESHEADVWACGTTLWEMYSFGADLTFRDHEEAKKRYLKKEFLPKPIMCPDEVYTLIKECWEVDHHRRKKPQAIMGEVTQQYFLVCNNAPEYAQPTSLPLLRISASNSTQSLISGVTESTNVYGGSLLSNEDNCYGLSYGEDKDINNFVDPKPGAFNYFDNMNKFEAQEGIRIDEECYVVPLNKIGQGNYGEVYRGKVSYHNDAKESRIVALKKLKREDEDTLLDFEREIQIMQKLKHPNIVEILTVVQVDTKNLIFIMEFVEHGSLQNYMRIHKEKIDDRKRLNFALDIIKGMEYLGRKKIVHRDLAARNILIDERDRAKISDFGLAQVLDDSGYYLLKSVRGIPYKWYALECLTKQKFSTSSDVWSFGVTVWEIFSDGEEPDLLNKDESHQDVQVQFIHKLQQGLNYPAPLNCKLQKVYTLLILPCWNRDPHDRPTFSELMKTTEDILRDI